MYTIDNIVEANLLKLKAEGFYEPEKLQLFNVEHVEQFATNEAFKQNMRAVYEFALKRAKFWYLCNKDKRTEKETAESIMLGKRLNELAEQIKLTKNPQFLTAQDKMNGKFFIEPKDRIALAGYTALSELLIDPRSRRYLDKVNFAIGYDFGDSSDLVEQIMNYTNDIACEYPSVFTETVKMKISIKEYELLKIIHEAHRDRGVENYYNIKTGFDSKYGSILKDLVLFLYEPKYLMPYQISNERTSIDKLMIELTASRGDYFDTLSDNPEKNGQYIADILFKYKTSIKDQDKMCKAIIRDKEEIAKIYDEETFAGDINARLKALVNKSSQSDGGQNRTRQ